ncbi:hypothetical protein [Actinomadura chibensis]|uniref:Uncharacterized protein n=1 Tax=Actinomadura chibensis TaxID=392828 RepID=A0A5D0NAI8_9ACTN|nr:hypothetical protein [Actinomadura chibensis]TYB41346.1 hypothetical protein FXF69_34985 [Actinomadura chibensis]
MVAAYIGFAGSVVGAMGTAGPVACSAIVSRGGESPTRSRVSASIVHTEKGATYAYQHPSMSSKPARFRPIYREGDMVEVVCQIRDGEPVSMPGQGRPDFAVSVWDQLPTGSWIPDIFTSLEYKRGPKPPPGVKLCAETTPAPAP